MSFSKRHGFHPEPTPIKVRQDAPRELREALLQIALKAYGNWGAPLEVVCQVLRRMDQNNWSHDFLEGEISRYVMGCAWFRVYDIAEALHKDLVRRQSIDEDVHPSDFQDDLNEVFEEQGIGWKMEAGEIQTRGDEPFEHAVQTAKASLQREEKLTTAEEFHQALQDMSRRPEPDLTGAVQHSNAGLECLMRDLCGDDKSTMGELLKRHGDKLAIPKPLDAALEKIWGFASNKGRHLVEGGSPSRDEAEFVVHLNSAMATYLLNRTDAVAAPPESEALPF